MRQFTFVAQHLFSKFLIFTKCTQKFFVGQVMLILHVILGCVGKLENFRKSNETKQMTLKKGSTFNMILESNQSLYK